VAFDDLRRALAAQGFVPATTRAAGSQGRREEARISPSQLIEHESARAIDVGAAVECPEPVAFLDGVQRHQVVAYGRRFPFPLVAGVVAAAVRERNGRRLETVTSEVRHLLIGRGEVLQPTLYAQAAEALLGKPVDISRLFYCTERGGYQSVEIPINDESRAALDKVIQTIDSSISNGFLPVAPRDGACRWCDYQTVCGPYEEVRVRRKPKDRLAGLDEIRKS